MPVPRLTKENYADLYRRVLPSSYVEPLDTEDDGAGMDLPYAFAAMMELADCATNKGTQSYFLRPHSDQTDMPAAGQSKAFGTFEIRRVGYSVGEVVVPAGTVVEAYRLDSYGAEDFVGRYVTLERVTVPEGTGTATPVNVEAEFPGYFGNLFADSVYLKFALLGRSRIPCSAIAIWSDTFFTRTVSAEDSPNWDWFEASNVNRYARAIPAIGVEFQSQPLNAFRLVWIDVGAQILLPSIAMSSGDDGKLCTVELLELSELGLVLSQPTAITGGNGGMLDARGADLGTSRLTGESDESLEARLEALDDTVSPPAIARTIDRVLGPLGIAWQLRETGDPKGLGGRVWDLHPWDFGSLGAVVSSAEVYDVQGAVWLSTSQTRRFFVVAVSSAITSEPFLASRLWNEVNAIREGGVGFRLVIDSTL